MKNRNRNSDRNKNGDKSKLENFLGKYSYFGEKTRKYRTIEISSDDADTTRIKL